MNSRELAEATREKMINEEVLLHWHEMLARWNKYFQERMEPKEVTQFFSKLHDEQFEKFRNDVYKVLTEKCNRIVDREAIGYNRGGSVHELLFILVRAGMTIAVVPIKDNVNTNSNKDSE